MASCDAKTVIYDFEKADYNAINIGLSKISLDDILPDVDDVGSVMQYLYVNIMELEGPLQKRLASFISTTGRTGGIGCLVMRTTRTTFCD